LVDLCLAISAHLLIHHPNKKNPTFSEEVGFGRRVRGNANKLYILGGILPEKLCVSMVFIYQICRFVQFDFCIPEIFYTYHDHYPLHPVHWMLSQLSDW